MLKTADRITTLQLNCSLFSVIFLSGTWI